MAGVGTGVEVGKNTTGSDSCVLYIPTGDFRQQSGGYYFWRLLFLASPYVCHTYTMQRPTSWCCHVSQVLAMETVVTSHPSLPTHLPAPPSSAPHHPSAAGWGDERRRHLASNEVPRRPDLEWLDGGRVTCHMLTNDGTVTGTAQWWLTSCLSPPRGPSHRRPSHHPPPSLPKFITFLSHRPVFHLLCSLPTNHLFSPLCFFIRIRFYLPFSHPHPLSHRLFSHLLFSPPAFSPASSPPSSHQPIPF